MTNSAMFTPLLEVMLNQKSFGGSPIINRPTPIGELDSEQDVYNVPEVYKDAAKKLNKLSFGAIDMRPETIQHLFTSYVGIGPFAALTAAAQDKGLKTGDIKQNKGEEFGPLRVALGLDMKISPTIMGAESESYRLLAQETSLLKRYRVSEQAHYGDEEVGAVSAAQVEAEGDGTISMPDDLTKKAERVKNELYNKGATAEEIAFAVNTIIFKNERNKLNKKLRQTGKDYLDDINGVREVNVSKDDLQKAALDIALLEENYVRENRSFMFRN